MESNVNDVLIKHVLAELRDLKEWRAKSTDDFCSASTSKLIAALLKVQQKMRGAKADKRNPRFGPYASHESVVAASRPLLTENELVVLQRVAQRGGSSFLITRLAHSSGEWMESSLPLVPENTTLQSFGSAMTYLKRYAHSALIGVTCGDDDDDAEAIQAEQERAPVISPGQLAALQRELKNEKELLKVVLEHKKIKSLRDLSPDSYESTMDWVKTKKAKREQGEAGG